MGNGFISLRSDVKNAQKTIFLPWAKNASFFLTFRFSVSTAVLAIKYVVRKDYLFHFAPLSVLENQIQMGLEAQSLISYSLIQFLKFILMKEKTGTTCLVPGAPNIQSTTKYYG